jgi:hypothetical protein
MRPERLTTESPIAESSTADQRTEGSHQRMVSHQAIKACDDYLQECEFCHDLFDIEQVSLQPNSQVLCAKCAAA